MPVRVGEDVLAPCLGGVVPFLLVDDKVAVVGVEVFPLDNGAASIERRLSCMSAESFLEDRLSCPFVRGEASGVFDRLDDIEEVLLGGEGGLSWLYRVEGDDCTARLLLDARVAVVAVGRYISLRVVVGLSTSDSVLS